MRSSIYVIGLLLFSTSTLANVAGFNYKYDVMLSGRVTLSQSHIDEMYEQFVSTYERPSATLNSNVDRKAIFAQRLQAITEHNAQDGVTYMKGINHLSDMTYEEVRSYYKILNQPQSCSATSSGKVGSVDLTALPDYFDWRDQGAVSPVKDQGSCGSCWTFSTVGAVESHFLVKYGQFRNLSEQQLVDCAGDYDNNGCNGGLPSHAFEYISDNGGLTTESLYPYKAVDQTCGVKSLQRSVGVVGGSVNITQNDENELQDALFNHGPVSVAFEVVDDFMDYSTGVYSSTDCKSSTMDVNHAVLAVGYGTENGSPYWIVKNSWSTQWGDQGYFKILRGKNMCGIAQCNAYPKDVIDLNNPVFLQ